MRERNGTKNLKQMGEKEELNSQLESELVSRISFRSL